MATATATLKDGRTIEYLPEVLGEGAMKDVYITPDRKSVVCFYKDPNAGTDPVRRQRMEAILGKYNPTVPRAQGGAAASDVDAGYYRALYCWPTDIVVKPRYGFVAPTYPSNFFFHSGPDFLKNKEKNGIRFSREKNRAMLKKFLPDELGTWINYFRFCIQMARAVMRLHMAGLAHSDLSPNNVLVDPTQGQSIVIDIDSLVVPGLFPPDVVGTPGYIAPEVVSTLHLPLKDPRRKHPSTATDLHALPVLIYQYLLLRHPLEGRKIHKAATAEGQELLQFGSQALFCENPTDPSNRPEEAKYVPSSALGPLLNDLFQRAFVKGLHAPNERPSAREWLNGLIKTWDLLMPCPNASCSHGTFVVGTDRNVACPFCGTKPKGTIPLLKFRSERKPGQFMPDGQTVVYHNLSLFKWHAYDNLFPGPGVDRTPQAYCVWHQGRWLLVNQNLTTLTSPGGNPVPPKQAVELAHGAKFRLSTEPHGRHVEVQIIPC
jgi:serine/threonine protein kinase